MAERNTKKLAQRIDRTYLGHLFGIPRWRRILTAVCLVIGLGWLGFFALTRNQWPYTAGPLSAPHGFVGRNCAVCHGSDMGVAKRVVDQKCAACHDAPRHNAQQVSNPACGDCHVEHRGIVRLAGLDDEQCAGCHSDLLTKNGKRTVNSHISTFATHPEFAAVRARQDPTGLKFNHAVHVSQSMKCVDCHPLAEINPGTGANAHSRVPSRSLRQVPAYAATCSPCHALNFDDKITDAAPHDKPAVVDRFVRDSLTKYIAAHPGDMGKDGSPRSQAAWVTFKAEADENTLWTTTCARCHAMGPAVGSGLPEVPPAKVTAVWFNRASFDHTAHQALTCGSCHGAAAKSTSSSELLLPGIAVCQNCHNSARASAGNSCATCHRYHDWSKEKGIDGKYKVNDMTELLQTPAKLNR
jgi:hypothetical protein